MNGVAARARRSWFWTVAALLVFVGPPSVGAAVSPTPASVLSVDHATDAARETRAHALFRQIRCVVCQNESIDDSEAPLAGDLRQIVREQIGAGRDDADIRRFLTDRYGEFVLLKPRFSPANAILWAAPFFIVLAGLAGFVVRPRGRLTPPPPLSEEERLRLGQLTARDESGATDVAPVDMLPPDTGLTKGYSVG